MPTTRCALVFAALAALVPTLIAAPAAASLVLSKAGAPVVEEARLAFAVTPTRTVAWEQLVLSPDTVSQIGDGAELGALAWIVAVPRGASVEQGDDHWLEALDEATAPVIAPAKVLACVDPKPISTARPRAITTPRSITGAFGPLSASSAIAKLGELGFPLDPATHGVLTNLDRDGEEIVILLVAPGTSAVTRVVRVVGPPSRRLPLALAPASTSGIAPPLRTWVLADARTKLAGVPAVEVDFRALSWSPSSTNYGTLLDAAKLAATPGAATVFAGKDGIFVDQSGATIGSTVPSLVRRAFGAGDGGDATSWTCAKRAQSYWASEKIVAAPCFRVPPWGSTLDAPSCAAPGVDQIAPGELSCGSADDLAAALAGMSPAAAWLTRLEAVSVPTPGRALERVALASIPSFHEAPVAPTCSGAAPSTPGGSPGPSYGDPTGGSSSGGSSSGSSTGGTASGPGVQGDGCGTTQIFADGCTGGPAPTPEDEEDAGSCDGSGSSGDGCSGDTSGDDADDGCSGEPYDDGSSDEGCAMDDGSEGSSDACTPSSDRDDDDVEACRISRGKRKRIRLSPVVYLLVAAAAVARRHGRRAGGNAK